ncbi:hypothetical protein [Micromonospora sp. NPDC048063]|uniref:hypothetical protein n=1 Tax=Micromonospora sp. NPDC048063 TaxID=3364256 RepID=UPI0037108BAC
MGDGLDDLGSYAPDTTVAAGLRDWASHLGGTVHRPRRPRHARGYTPALLFTIILKLPGGPGRFTGRKLLVKVLPAAGAARREPGRHERAVRSSPGFAQRHLVRQPYPPHPLADGRYLMFQEVANGADDMVTLHDLDDEEIVPVIRTVCDRVLNDWNSGGQQTADARVAEYVQRELAALDALDGIHDAIRDLDLPGPETRWLTLNDGELVLPHPLQTLETGSPFGTAEMDYLYGNAHGDLHGGNILVPRDAEERLAPGAFRLVDLDTFEDAAPLTRDPVTLVLTTVLRHVADLPSDQAEALTRHLVFPTTRRPLRLPPMLAELVQAGHEVGDAFARTDNWVSEWRAQYLLSLLCQALTCCTYDDVPPAARRWCFMLAAWALEAHRREFRPLIEPPLARTPSTTADRNEPAPILALDNGHRSRYEPPGPRPGQPNSRGPVARTQVDVAWPPPHATLSGAPPTGDGPVGWHGAGPAPVPRLGTDPALPLRPDGGGNRPAFHSRPVGDNASAPRTRPPSTGPRLFRSRPAPRHLVTPAGRRVPRTRPAPRGERVPAAPARPAVRVPARVGVLLGVAVALGVVLVPTLTANPPSVFGRRESPHPPPPEDPPTSPAGTANAGARRPLNDLAQSVAGLVEPPGEGPYTFVCLRAWSPKDLAPGTDDPRTYRDEQLWWNSRLAGRRIVTPVIDGRRSTDPSVVRYGEGDLTEVPPRPSADPADLREQFAQQLGALPPEQRDAAGTLQVVARLNRYHQLGAAERSALLHHLADTPGIEARGAYPDRAGRPGLAFSADDRHGRRETLLFDPGSGELLSHETTRVADDAVLGHQLFLRRGRTDTVSGPSCR